MRQPTKDEIINGLQAVLDDCTEIQVCLRNNTQSWDTSDPNNFASMADYIQEAINYLKIRSD